MSYDNWKLSNPQDDGWTSHEVKHNLCDDSEIYYCSECGEDNYAYEIISQHEYNERSREDAQEWSRDE